VGGPAVRGGLLNSALRFLRCNKYKNINAAAASIFIQVRGIHSNPFPAFYRPIKIVGRLTCLLADKNRPILSADFYRSSDCGFRILTGRVTVFLCCKQMDYIVIAKSYNPFTILSCHAHFSQKQHCTAC